ncbi:MAG TPA: phosphatase PAP2 family protein [Thermoanaerobaculia bacterium]|nr:phosphatase PAP2 family protein [Thermoanaerobaculia bacterium]
MTHARIHWRPHAYEIIIVANLLLIHALLMRNTNSVLTSLPLTMITALPSMVIQALIAILVRLAIAYYRGNAAEYLREIRKPAWILEASRLIFGAALMLHVYGWIKLAIPLLHPRLFDQQLWELDRSIFFGISPNIFFLNLFSNPVALRAIDYSYAYIFVTGLCVSVGYFVSSPSKRLQVAFITGHSILWLAGAWLYVLIPALGPAYRFPDIWMQYSHELRITQSLQAQLWTNYANVLKIPYGGHAPLNILLGIAAFPSLHVAFQLFIFLWFRRLWTWGEVTFAIFVLFIFLGAMITGWHYLTDLIAGLLLAWLTWVITSRRYKILRFTHLSRVL